MLRTRQPILATGVLSTVFFRESRDNYQGVEWCLTERSASADWSLPTLLARMHLKIVPHAAGYLYDLPGV
jgi:hypothetical protein